MRHLEIVRALAAREVRYVIVGGVAVILHGVPRATYDLDLLADLSPDNVRALVEALEGLGFRPRAPVAARDLADPARRAEWAREKGLRAFSFWHPRGGEVDVLIEAPVDYAAAAQDALVLDVEGAPVPVASIETLVRMKQGTGREQDRSDIEALEKARRIAREEEGGA